MVIKHYQPEVASQSRIYKIFERIKTIYPNSSSTVIIEQRSPNKPLERPEKVGWRRVKSWVEVLEAIQMGKNVWYRVGTKSWKAAIYVEI